MYIIIVHICSVTELELYVTLSKEGLLNGHTRSSSGDTQLITVNDSGMKRTQSNSSLSEDHRYAVFRVVK